MRPLRYFTLLFGYVALTVRGRPERFLSAASRLGVPLFSVSKTGADVLSAKVTPPDARKLLKSGLITEADVTARRGLPYFLKKRRKRLGFLIGFALFFAVIFYLFSFIWDVNVYGLETIDEKELMSALTAEGVFIGGRLSSLDAADAEFSLYSQFLNIKWIQIEKRGTTVNVYLKEGEIRSLPVPENTPADVVASKDGVVLYVAAYGGHAVAKDGDVVKKGDLLISGAYLNEKGEERETRAYGKVMANTVNIIEAEVPLGYFEDVRTEEKTVITSFRVFGLSFGPFGSLPEFGEYDVERNKTQISLFGVDLPIFITEDVFYRTVKVKRLIGERTAVEKAENIVNKLQNERFSGIIINESVDYYAVSDGVVRFERYLYCTEDIAETAPLRRAESEEEK